MRKILLASSLFSGILLSTASLNAQQADRYAYAITDATGQNSNWSFLRKLDLNTGEYSQVLLDGNNAQALAWDAATKKQMATPLQDARYGQWVNAAFGTSVAAIAYDKVHDRIYYTPMFVDQLRYIDMKTMKVFFVNNETFTGKAERAADQSNIVTRMVIADDGYGYAITNDGMQMIRFSTGKKFQIENLGQLVDDANNKGLSIHNSCTSYGGDVVADDDGNIYILTARNHIFKINLQSKVATHLGAVTGLPEGFTINGAAVNENNKVVVSSAVVATNLYQVDLNSLKATPLTGQAVWHSSDLANSNIILSGKNPKQNNADLFAKNAPVDQIGNNKIAVYPNPVTNNQFRIQFNALDAGNYTVQITDAMGRQINHQAVVITSESQSQLIKLPSTSRGIYMVTVTDAAGKSLSGIKLVVQ
ncbi:MAG: T9SS type A sorting domain-containing protein [Bacteroidetes bacterium]|nr:T9SS type A sorting domain-containing protein [Bacteroidota bacterium]